MGVDGEAPQEESAEVQSQKRKVIRVESEETQDYVRETLAISQEAADEVCFVPSALSEPRGPTYWCDNRCSEKAVRYWQIGPLVVEEGGPHKQFVPAVYNEQSAQQGKSRLKLWQWRRVVDKKAHRGRLGK